MKRILFITDFYYPQPTSIGISTHKITKELQLNGNDVHVLSFGAANDIDAGDYEDVKLHYVKFRLYDRLLKFYEKRIGSISGKIAYIIAMILIRMPGLFFLGLYPMNSIINIYYIYRMAKKLHNKYSYDMVISTYSPFDGLIAGYLIKRKFKDLLLVLYVLDTLSNRGPSKWFSSKWTERKGYKWERRIYPYADAVLNMKCHEGHHNNERYNQFRERLYTVDIPLFEPKEFKDGGIADLFDHENTHFVYTGRILSHLTSPEYLCELFLKLSENQDYKLHFFSSGDCETVLMQYQKQSNEKIIREGFVERNIAMKAVFDADILVSIGCAESMKVPSKIFDYMSAGKKIIHIKKSDLDIALTYYEKYPLALILSEDDSYDENISRIKDFLYTEKDFNDIEDLNEVFKINKPNHTADIIEQLFAKETLLK